jgi:CRP/FNR family transcriptional regulator
MPAKSKLWYLENLNLLRGLSKDDMMAIAKITSMQTVGKNQVIYFPDEPSTSFYFLKEGHVKLSRISEDGREITLSLLGPGEIFGEFALSESSTRDDIATAADEVVICAVNQNQIETSGT